MPLISKKLGIEDLSLCKCRSLRFKMHFSHGAWLADKLTCPFPAIKDRTLMSERNRADRKKRLENRS